MAKRNSGVGLWMAVVVLGIIAAAFGGMYFSQQTQVDIMKKSLREDDPTVFVNQHGNAKVAGIIAVNQDLTEKVDKFRSEIVGLQKKHQDIEKDIRTEERRAEEAQRLAEDAQNAQKSADAQITTLRRQVESERGKYDKTLSAEIDSLKQQVLDEKSGKKRIEDEKRRLEEREQTLVQSSLARVRELESEIQALRQAINNKQQAIANRENIQGEQYDGEIIEVDTKNKLVVVNIGQTHNVHRGMQFSVIRWRLNQWQTIATVELTKVDTTTSVGVILDSSEDGKTCPKCGYLAHTSEERFCPFCSGGENGDRVEQLVRMEASNISSMNPMDPIVVGDFVSNPFFSKKRHLKFVITGEPIHYSPDLIKSRISEYGGQVAETVDVDTDYVILGRIPDETTVITSDENKKRVEEYRKAVETARQYGITILRETDLFEFLHK